MLQNVAWGTNILDQRVFNADVMERFYGDAGPPDIQRLGVLFLTLAVGALFDLSMQPGALSECFFFRLEQHSSQITLTLATFSLSVEPA